MRATLVKESDTLEIGFDSRRFQTATKGRRKSMNRARRERKGEMPELNEGTRVRMNFGMNAKGLIQMDLTVEMPTVKEAEIEAGKAIDAYRAICLGRGLKLVDAVA